MTKKKSEDTAVVGVSLVTQGNNKFYTATIPIAIITQTCFVSSREIDPEEGFQRMLDKNRAEEIANYLDKGGAIPNSIVLSAQSEAGLEYSSKKRSVTFNLVSNAFLILDGQHRVFGFRKANLSKLKKIRIPVVIFNNLSRAEEAKLFIDINTKQKPVPNELLLDIKKLALTEVTGESFCREIFDYLNTETDSCLRGMMSPSSKDRNKITRPQFNNAIKPFLSKISNNDAYSVYSALNQYIESFKIRFNELSDKNLITNATNFTAMLYIFPAISRKMKDKYSGSYSLDNYLEVLEPILSRIDLSILKKFAGSPKKLSEMFEKYLDEESIVL